MASYIEGAFEAYDPSSQRHKTVRAFIHRKISLSTAEAGNPRFPPEASCMYRLFAGCAAVAVWLATLAAMPAGQPVAGIHCDRMEGNVLHIHQHLAIFDHGKPVGIPEDVGRPLFGNCLYWLHTHTPDGLIHVESPTLQAYTLGQFFAVWGQPLARSDVAGAKLRPGEKTTVWVDGAVYAGDPAKIQLTQHLDVTIDVGAPRKKPAPFAAWNGQ
jgi:hypothetical protein